MKQEKKTLELKEILSLVTTYCSREEHCEYDILLKIKPFDLKTDQVEEILSHLKTQNYINELRYTEAFVNDKFRFNKWGKIKIAYALQQKKISHASVNMALENIDADKYFNLLLEELNKKNKSIRGKSDYETKGMLYRFAASRGFESDIINRAIDKII